jgi:hypothetical protein
MRLKHLPYCRNEILLNILLKVTPDMICKAVNKGAYASFELTRIFGTECARQLVRNPHVKSKLWRLLLWLWPYGISQS